MPKAVFITLSGFRICDPELLELGLTLPGFHDRADALAELPALGLITLAGMMPQHWECIYRAPPQITEAFLQQVVSSAPDLVVISALTASILEAYHLSQHLRQQGLTTVLGGLHVTACPTEAMHYADAICVGAGEAIWPQLIADFELEQLRPRYDAPRINSNQLWSMPRYDLLGDVNRYTLQTARGCPLACDFCGASRLIERFREKPASVIEQELAQLNQLDSAPLIELADDNTFAGTRDVDQFFDLFTHANARWFTEADWRIGERPEILNRLAASGCVQVLVGLESQVFRYPGMGPKSTAWKRLLDSVDAIQESGVCVNGCFIVGAEGETRESMERLTEFLLEAPLAEVQVTLQTPYPGTGLYHRLKEEKRLLTDRPWSYYTLFETTYLPDIMSVSELESGFREIITHVYGLSATKRRQRIRHRIWRNNPRLNPTGRNSSR